MQLVMGYIDPNVVKPVAICAIFLLAILGSIIIALLDHQRKMAEIMRSDRKQTDGLDQRVDALQTEVRELRTLLSTEATVPAVSDDLQQRIR
jgi:hypothetical protein